jgi:predicted  nucleic acid-binding Zn-ribbon protein
MYGFTRNKSRKLLLDMEEGGKNTADVINPAKLNSVSVDIVKCRLQNATVGMGLMNDLIVKTSKQYESLPGEIANVEKFYGELDSEMKKLKNYFDEIDQIEQCVNELEQTLQSFNSKTKAMEAAFADLLEQ